MITLNKKQVAGANLQRNGGRDHSKNAVSPKNHKSRRNFLKMAYFALFSAVFIFSGCGEDPKISGVAKQRYETVPYVSSSSKTSDGIQKIGGIDNLVFCDYDDNYNYYFFVLGHINSAPLAYRPAVYYNGVTPITVEYSSSNVTQTSIRNSVTEAFEHSVTQSYTTTWGNEMGVSVGLNIGGLLSAITANFKASYRHSWGGSDGTSTTDSRSFSNTYETSSSKAEEIKDAISVTIGNNGEPTGLYRYSLFSTTDVYFIVITDRAKTRIIEANVVFCARPTQFWALDYEPEIGGSFGKTASGELLQIPDINISQLPDIAECQHNWGDWVVTTPPTSTTEGEETRICTLCGKTEARIVPILPILTTGTFNLATGVWTEGNGNATFSNNVLTVTDGARIIITTNGANTTRRIVVNGIVSITLRDVSITGLSAGQTAMTLNAGARATITLEGTNILTSGITRAGIQTTGATLTINGEGSLTATGGRGENGAGGANDGGNGGGAGIGGSYGSDGGTIIINSGMIEAQGGKAGNGGDAYFGGGNGKGGGGAGAGIGGGGGRGSDDRSDRGLNGGAGGTITINGGTVEANGGAQGNNGSNGGGLNGGVGRGGGIGMAYGGGGYGGRSGKSGSTNGSQGAAGTFIDNR